MPIRSANAGQPLPPKSTSHADENFGADLALFVGDTASHGAAVGLAHDMDIPFDRARIHWCCTKPEIQNYPIIGRKRLVHSAKSMCPVC